MKKLLQSLIMFIIGGFLYIGIEFLYRGYSDFSMYFAGGLSFMLIGLMNEWFSWKLALISKMLISSIIITTIELLVGLIVNVWLKEGVWDYSAMPYNFMGQICLLFSNLWFLLSLPAIFLDDLLKYILFKEKIQKYRIF